MPSLRTFCQKTDHARLLRSFFANHGIDLVDSAELPSDADAKAIADFVQKALKETATTSRAVLERNMARIEKLSGELGEYALEQATLTDDIQKLPSGHARALQVFLFDNAGFRRAEEIMFNDDRRGGRQWTAFPAVKNLDLSCGGEAINKLKTGMQEQFQTKNVHLEVIQRTRPQLPTDEAEDDRDETELVQITIYRETLPNTEYIFREGEFGTEVRHPVLEASVTYEPSTGMIECVAPQRDDRKEIARLLAVNVLGCSPDFEPVAGRAYDLSVLKQRQEFCVEPEDRIEGVSIEMLKLAPLGSVGELITVENKAKNTRDIWTVIDERLGPDALQNDYTIMQAKVVVRYRPPKVNSTRSLPVTITHPNRSNLKERTEVERAVANKYLSRWGLVAAA